jgi:hypothetical protein
MKGPAHLCSGRTFHKDSRLSFLRGLVGLDNFTLICPNEGCQLHLKRLGTDQKQNEFSQLRPAKSYTTFFNLIVVLFKYSVEHFVDLCILCHFKNLKSSKFLQKRKIGRTSLPQGCFSKILKNHQRSPPVRPADRLELRLSKFQNFKNSQNSQNFTLFSCKM